jgi:secreted trypsin-like serine protease
MIILLAFVQPTYEVLYSCDPTATCGCSSYSASVTRIVGGEEAGVSTWSWTVSISIGYFYFCAGSILSSSWIITAAHCFDDLLGTRVVVYAGSNIRLSGTQDLIASRVILHPAYDSVTFTNDIALLQLADPLNMSDPNVSAICMPLVSSTILASSEWPVADTTVSLFCSSIAIFNTPNRL